MKQSAARQNEVTQILKKVNYGSKKACDTLLPLIYDKLLEIAQNHIGAEYSDHTYCRTELVHEVYFQLIDIDNINWQNRTHFFAIASKCMRQILVDYARKKKADKRGGDRYTLTYRKNMLKIKNQADDLIDLDDALNKLAMFNERLARVVECRYFGDMTIEDTAIALEVSESTVKRDWRKARGWLYNELNDEN